MARIPSGPVHPIVRDLLFGLGRIGAKAVGAGFDSVLEDVDGFANEVAERTKKARSRLKKIMHNAADQIADDEDEGQDIDLTNEE
jgi:hypothetical protein